MNKKLLALLACVLVLAAFVATESAQTTPTPTPVTPAGHRGHGPHPAIQGAIRALERAKADLQAANHDFGGHRADALAACDTAIAQLQLALQYANNNQAGAQPTPTP